MTTVIDKTSLKFCIIAKQLEIVIFSWLLQWCAIAMSPGAKQFAQKAEFYAIATPFNGDL